jgi:hypothetical protein
LPRLHLEPTWIPRGTSSGDLLLILPRIGSIKVVSQCQPLVSVERLFQQLCPGCVQHILQVKLGHARDTWARTGHLGTHGDIFCFWKSVSSIGSSSLAPSGKQSVDPTLVRPTALSSSFPTHVPGGC